MKTKYKVGQVVSLRGLEFYRTKARRAEMFQLITHVEPWPKDKHGRSCLSFQNGDRCHEKFVRLLTAKECASQ
jgi:hypothetical protein